jgi:hypothetical protein
MKTFACVISVAALAVCLGGCNSNRDVSYKHITSHLTPELKGLSERPVDDHNAFAITSNSNLRLFWDDIGRSLYTDTPSRLSPMPVINTTGQPR